MPQSPAIRVKGLKKRFAHRWALDGIDLTVDRGEFLTLFGPNGAGKTTLVRVLSQLVRPTAGEIRIDGRAIDEYGPEIRKDIGVISHHTMVYPSLTGRENLFFFAKLFGVEDPARRVDEVLEEVALTARADAPVRTYSRGMAQRMAIARAILHAPRIVLLDEPYTGLDERAADRFTRLLDSLADGSRTFLLTTHNLEQGLELSNRIAIQISGRIVFEADAGELDHASLRKQYLELTREARI